MTGASVASARPSRVVCICTAGRSGSTLLDLMLGSHSDYTSLGEIEHLPKNIALDSVCSCGEPVSRCGFWQSVFDQLSAQQAIDPRVKPYAFMLGLHRASREIDPDHQTRMYLLKRLIVLAAQQRRLSRAGSALPRSGPVTAFYDRCLDHSAMVYRAVASVSGRPGVVDSSKEYRRAVSLYLRDPDMVRIVLLSRDGRGVMRSNMRSGTSAQQAVRSWTRYYQRALPLIESRVSAAHVFRLRYEELVEDPRAVLTALMQFLGSEFDPAMLAFRQGEKHVLNGNDMRAGGTQALRRDDRWRQELGEEELSLFEQMGGQRVNQQLGHGA